MRVMTLSGVLAGLVLTPSIAFAQSPFEEEGDPGSPPATTKPAAPPSPSASTKTVAPTGPPATVPTAEDDGDDDDDGKPATKPSLTTTPRLRHAEGPSRGFRVVSYSKQITLVLTSPNQGATFSMQSGSSRGDDTMMMRGDGDGPED
jgi:hypothetical protein